MATLVSISLYEALTTKKFRAKAGQEKVFDFEGYIDKVKQFGIRYVRMFADLNYFFYNGAAHFRPDWAALPYPATPIGFNFAGPLNPEFVSRVQSMGVKGTKAPTLNFQICFMTQGPDYGSPFFAKMGYPQSKLYYDRADDPANPEPWKKLQKYAKDLHTLFNKKPVRFGIYELYNERAWGHLDDEFKGLKDLVAPVAKMQLNADRIDRLKQLPDWNADGFQKWVNRLKSGNLGYKISRFSFHGVYTPADVAQIVTDCGQFGITPQEIDLQTDGATPWRNQNGSYRFTYQSHAGHYLARPTWDQSPSNIECVISAHKAIRDAAVAANVAVCGFQSVLKWQEDLVFRPSTERFYSEVMS